MACAGIQKTLKCTITPIISNGFARPWLQAYKGVGSGFCCSEKNHNVANDGGVELFIGRNSSILRAVYRKCFTANH